MNFKDYDRARHEEMARIDAREFHARHQERARQQEIDKLQRRQRHVIYHGREDAFWITVKRWMLGAAILAVITLPVGIHDDGFLKGVGEAFGAFAAWTGIGVIRAYYIINSVD